MMPPFRLHVISNRKVSLFLSELTVKQNLVQQSKKPNILSQSPPAQNNNNNNKKRRRRRRNMMPTKMRTSSSNSSRTNLMPTKMRTSSSSRTNQPTNYAGICLVILVSIVLAAATKIAAFQQQMLTTIPTITPSIQNNRTGKRFRVGTIIAPIATSIPTTKATSSSSSSSSSSSLFSTTNDSKDISEAEKFLEQAAQLRAEIAAAEGKTIEEVEREASTKKQHEQQRREKQAIETASAKKRIQDSKGLIDTGAGDRFVQVPLTVDDMVRQASRAVERAFAEGYTRQIVRFNLISVVNEGDTEQAATDENEWPGGAKQIYREAGAPLTEALLREVRAPTKNKYPEKRSQSPKLTQQPVWDFDGTAIHTAEAAEGPSADIQAYVFPNTDTKYLQDIDDISTAIGSERLFLLVNPSWKNVDSWGFNILAPNAKQRAQKVIFGGNDSDDTNGSSSNNGKNDDASGTGTEGTSKSKLAYEETYSMNVFYVRGEKCVALNVYPYDWQIFAFREDDYYQNEEYTIRLGSIPRNEDPTSSVITKLINARPEFKETKTMRQMKKLGGGGK